MSDIMRPMPFAQLMDWILSEYAEQGSIFGESRIVKKRTGHARPIFDEKIETPTVLQPAPTRSSHRTSSLPM